MSKFNIFLIDSVILNVLITSMANCQSVIPPHFGTFTNFNYENMMNPEVGQPSRDNKAVLAQPDQLVSIGKVEKDKKDDQKSPNPIDQAMFMSGINS